MSILWLSKILILLLLGCQPDPILVNLAPEESSSGPWRALSPRHDTLVCSVASRKTEGLFTRFDRDVPAVYPEVKTVELYQKME
jgi:hypothetical protein